MGVPIGAQGHLGIRKESSFASGGSIDVWQPFTSESLELQFQNVYTDRVQNTAEQVDGQQGNEIVTGTIIFPVYPQGPSEWFACGIGQASSPFFNARPASSLIVQIDKETGAVQASGCMINTIAFSSSQGAELVCSADIEAVGLSNVTAGTPSWATITNDAPYLHSDATFSLNGSNDNSVTAWSLSVANNLGTDLFGTNRKRIDIPAGKMVVTGSFTKLFDDTTERNAFLNAQVRSLKVTYARAGAFLIFNLPKIRYNTRPDPIGGQSDYILETFSFTGYVDNVGAENSLRVTGDFTL